MSICSVLYPYNDFQDETGCLKSHHNDAHIFRTKDGRFIEWEDYYDCNCGCWDNYENNTNACILYKEVDVVYVENNI